MSIRRRIYLSLLASAFITLLLSFLIIYYISSQLLESRVRETYSLIYNNYRQILDREEKNLHLLPREVALHGIYHQKKLTVDVCKERPHYRVLSTGPYYGINKLYPEGCYFVGVSLEELLKFTTNLMGVDWVVYYERAHIGELMETSVDEFMRGKIVIDSLVVDQFSNQRVLKMPLRVSGYALHGSLLSKYLLMELPFTNWEGLHVGKVVLVKDVSDIYREVYTIFLALALYSLLMVSFLSFVLLRISSRLASRIIFLKDVTAGIEKKEFSVVNLLEKEEGDWKDEVQELKNSIRNMAVSLRSAFMELEKKQKELEELAYHDPLTGLPNRRFFFDHASLLLENARRYGTPMSLLIMDIDFFKKINDTYGHEAGDMVLRNFANLLKKGIRHSDLPARLGGEEFALLMPNTDLHQAKTVAERIRRSLKDSPLVYEGQEIRATLSGGLVAFSGSVKGVDELIRMADEALYTAKNSGRDRIEVYVAKK
ncbi:MAG: GGDEF domain-containing protein [Aquificaceae bacterium]|nr:GGDEF domain-containing protein [Aquificaceae bacterium]